ncbi:MAG: ribosome maturation factor RimP [Calditrichaceae bacterium]
MDIREKLEQIVKSICSDLNLVLVEIKYKGDAKNPIFQVFADSEQGITMGECENLSREIKDEIDMDDLFPEKYRLDVSSPGIDRPLVEDYEFKKNIGQELLVRMNLDHDGIEYTGKLLEFDSDEIRLQDRRKNIIKISRPAIDQAKVKLKW